MSFYVLIDTLETKRRGKNVYFECWTGIGPMYTEELENAEKFATKQHAMESPAYPFAMCFFEPMEVSA